MAAVKKIDSNATGLRYAEETSIGVLPGTPVWNPMEPNSYDSFGGEYAMEARSPINEGRQRLKGVIVDLDASGGFNTDVTQTNLEDILQGFFFADLRPKAELAAWSSVDGSLDKYVHSAGATVFVANDLILASGFSTAANNGIKTVASSTATDVLVDEVITTEASPPAASELVAVGHEFAAGDLEVDSSGSLPLLTTTTKDLTELGLNPGEFIYIGGDAAATSFATVADNGWARVKSVATNAITLDKTSGTMVTDAGAAKTIRLFFGRVLKNEALAVNQVRRTYNIERTLGAPDDTSANIQSEYLVGAVPSELTFTFNTAEKLTADLSFVATSHEQRTATVGVKSGTRPTLVSGDAYNSTNDFSRLKMAILDPADSAPTSLFAYLTEFTVSINNNLSANKAISVLGAMDVSAGNFDVDGNANAYFSDVESVAAIQNNSNVTLDFAIVRGAAGAKTGIVVDMPLIALGDGRLNVEQDSPIMLPLDTPAAADATFNHTLLMSFFDYLPNAADTA